MNGALQSVLSGICIDPGPIEPHLVPLPLGLGGRSSALFSTCDVKGVSSAPEDALTSPEAAGPSSAADDEAPTLTPVNTPYVPEPPPSAAGRAAALHLWLQVCLPPAPPVSTPAPSPGTGCR